MFQSARHIPHVLHAERAVDRAARRGRRRPVRGGLAAQRAQPRAPVAQRRAAPRLQRRALLHQTSAPGQGQKLTKRPIMSGRVACSEGIQFSCRNTRFSLLANDATSDFFGIFPVIFQ